MFLCKGVKYVFNMIFLDCRYGSRQMTEKCSETIILVCLQSILGFIISSSMAGIVSPKLARLKAKAHTIMFSKN